MSRFSVTRRALFRGIGTATLVGACKPSGKTGEPGADGQSPGPGEVGPDPTPVQFELNGREVTATVEPRTTLLEALRLDLDATGTKVVCDRGACGACTVLVNGVPRNSCMMLAHDAVGAEITTVEGLAEGDQLSRLQQAFVSRDALQCGFCTSGMLMSCAALLRRNPGPVSPDQVKDAIAGNQCRCGTYPHVVAAVLDVAKSGGGR